MTDSVWFWQRIVSPHMAGLAVELATLGVKVTYVAERPMTEERAAQGWIVPDLGDAKAIVAGTEEQVAHLVATAPVNSIHICQGLRGNGVVAAAQRALAARGLRQWVVMETVEEHGRLATLLKRLEYRRLISVRKNRIAGVLATGYETPAWLAQMGMPGDRIYPFAYFLMGTPPVEQPVSGEFGEEFRFLFVGNFIERKRIDLLLRALAMLGRQDFRLDLVGSGPLELELGQLADRLLPGRVRWIGRLAQLTIPATIATADCLVLPSRHDGWGAVVSEALMVGTPAICSDRCGVAEVVKRSGQGGLFAAGNSGELAALLSATLARGPQKPEQRKALKSWASCLGAPAGARYLAAILKHAGGIGARPAAPWVSTSVERDC